MMKYNRFGPIKFDLRDYMDGTNELDREEFEELTAAIAYLLAAGWSQPRIVYWLACQRERYAIAMSR